MSVSDEILKHLGELPESSQEEVLDFIEYLELKHKNVFKKGEWESFSLASAMKGLEHEESPYSEEDIKESTT